MGGMLNPTCRIHGDQSSLLCPRCRVRDLEAQVRDLRAVNADMLTALHETLKWTEAMGRTSASMKRATERARTAAAAAIAKAEGRA